MKGERREKILCLLLTVSIVLQQLVGVGPTNGVCIVGTL